ncbi:CDP-alcohol phosphatidyltransferase family protein [Clostridium estertheticum]|uniref:CDP-alcohol phosphatidyltransferase family protein n=1 Tax=Clostridium estertheticum TaxID=238834 RepID=UPI0013E91989|nr:CDP-alcohol phosphatidyltransferase family protein [Clostridium estertheticum]MBZ9686613.1 CDP-alcohol phosphatidyltransferase family protein [Clostridium estertheticum]
MLDTHGRKYISPLFKGAANIFLKLNMTPNNITIIGFIIGLLPFVFIYFDKPLIAVILLWVSGFLDAVDGEMARISKMSTPLGTLMDVTFDRLVELGVILAIALKEPKSMLQLLFLTSTIIISMTVFLTVGALSRNKGSKYFYYQTGVAERTEGFIFFTLMILIPVHLQLITSIFSIIIAITALQRFLEARRILK